MLVPEPAFEGASEMDCGSVIIRSAIVVMPRAVNSEALTVVTGSASSAARRLMLEPVISTRCVASCAWAEPARPRTPRVMADKNSLEDFWSCSFIVYVSFVV